MSDDLIQRLAAVDGMYHIIQTKTPLSATNKLKQTRFKKYKRANIYSKQNTQATEAATEQATKLKQDI
jgi:hypothetical protein